MFTVDDINISSYMASVNAEHLAPTLVLCHGFPAQRSLSLAFGETYPELADRLATDTGWHVTTFDFRGTGKSGGDFSLMGWVRDLQGAINFARENSKTTGVWVAGFGTGGSLSIVAAAMDEKVKGIASFGSPAHFDDWAHDPQRCLLRARESGAVKTVDFPTDFDAWSHEFSEVRPDDLITKIPPRPIMLVHGSDDEVVSDEEARLLSDAAGPNAELRIIGGAGHDLRHDPRSIALLAGWMDRHKS